MREEEFIIKFYSCDNEEQFLKDIYHNLNCLQQENKILRENAEHNDKVVDKVNWENMLLKKENQELKSQLAGTTFCYDEEEHRKLQENYDRIYAENCKLREEHNINDISLLDENQKLKDNWSKLKEWVNKYYDYYTNEKDYIGGRLCFTDMKNKIQELEQGSDE